MPGDPLIAVKCTAVGKSCHYHPMTLLTMCCSSHWDLHVVNRHPSCSQWSKLDNGLCLCLHLLLLLPTTPGTLLCKLFKHFDTLSIFVSSLPLICQSLVSPSPFQTSLPLPSLSSTSAPGISTLQVLTALLWKSMVCVALSHLPEDEVINIGLAVNSQERTPTCPASSASLPAG